MFKSIVLSTAAIISFQSLAMEEAESLSTQTEEANSKIIVTVTSTDLGGKFGSINVLEFEVDSSIKVNRLYSLIQAKLLYFNDINLTLQFNYGSFRDNDERTLKERGIKGNLKLKASRVYR